MVGVTAYKTEVNAEAVYIGVSLYELDKEGNYTNEKILVWDKVPAKEVETKKTFEERLEFSLQVKWISNENINLNGKIINLVDRYDYRRDLRNWMKYIMDYFSLVFIYNESRFE